MFPWKNICIIEIASHWNKRLCHKIWSKDLLASSFIYLTAWIQLWLGISAACQGIRWHIPHAAQDRHFIIASDTPLHHLWALPRGSSMLVNNIKRKKIANLYWWMEWIKWHENHKILNLLQIDINTYVLSGKSLGTKGTCFLFNFPLSMLSCLYEIYVLVKV